MREQFPPITINFTPVKVVGIPGLSLVAIVVAIAVQFPEARWLLLSGLAGGMVLAATLILVRRSGVDPRASGPLARLRARDHRRRAGRPPPARGRRPEAGEDRPPPHRGADGDSQRRPHVDLCEIVEDERNRRP